MCQIHRPMAPTDRPLRCLPRLPRLPWTSGSRPSRSGSAPRPGRGSRPTSPPRRNGTGPLPSLDTAAGVRGAPGVGADHVRRPLVGGVVARGVRGPRRRALRVAHLRGGVLPGRGAHPGGAERHLPPRPHAVRVRDARAEGALSPAPWRRARRSGARDGPSPTPAATSPPSAAGPRDRHGDAWVLNGQKTWCSRGAFADWIFGLFRSDPEAERHRGLTYFLVKMDSPGRDRPAHRPARRRDRVRRGLLRGRGGARRAGARWRGRGLEGGHGHRRLRTRPVAAQPGPLHRGGRRASSSSTAGGPAPTRRARRAAPTTWRAP